MKTKLEIEKRYLLKYLPSIKEGTTVLYIQQYYTPKGRLRCSKDTYTNQKIYYLTIKKSLSFGVNQEKEKKITEKEFLKLKKKATKFISKYRYLIKDKKRIWEVDQFIGMGLIIAELELKTEKELKTVKIPKFIQDMLILDITGIKEFSNFNLADPR